MVYFMENEIAGSGSELGVALFQETSIWLVVWNMDFICPETVGHFIIPSDLPSYLSEGVAQHQPEPYSDSSESKAYFWQTYKKL